jgi:outer membrane protein assembly factor BamA
VRVESIALDGDDLPMSALRAALATPVGAPLDDAALARDRAALEAVLVSRGYLAAHVAPAQVLSDGGAADVTFEVRPGRQFVISHVSVVGASPLDAGVVTLSPGDPVLASRLAEARQALTARLVSRGAPHATITTHLTPDLAHGTATVVFEAGTVLSSSSSGT